MWCIKQIKMRCLFFSLEKFVNDYLLSGLYGLTSSILAGLKTPFFSTQGFDEVENCPGMVSKGNQTRAGFPKGKLAGLFWTLSNPSNPDEGVVSRKATTKGYNFSGVYLTLKNIYYNREFANLLE